MLGYETGTKVYNVMYRFSTVYTVENILYTVQCVYFCLAGRWDRLYPLPVPPTVPWV